MFRPARALEVGCATGIVVHHLNALGCDAHGIDVSEWAVAHREHPNVVLAGAEDLPYEDDSFDLVFSVHALEHIPPELEEAAMSELTRVSRPAALQFHLLPIVGRGPHGTPEAIAGLRNDPTHNLIRRLGEWSARWRQFGWSETGLLVLVRNDTESFELSSCHWIVLARQDVPRDVIERIRDSNLDVAQSLFTAANTTRATPLDVLSTMAPIQNPAELRFVASQWQDLAATFDPPAQLSGAAFPPDDDARGREHAEDSPRGRQRRQRGDFGRAAPCCGAVDSTSLRVSRTLQSVRTN